jgi:hypothetical protein
MLSENSISEKLAVPEKPQQFLWNNSFLTIYQNRCKVLYIVTYILQNAPLTLFHVINHVRLSLLSVFVRDFRFNALHSTYV